MHVGCCIKVIQDEHVTTLKITPEQGHAAAVIRVSGKAQGVQERKRRIVSGRDIGVLSRIHMTCESGVKGLPGRMIMDGQE